MRPYVIRQGDYLTGLAYGAGFDADEVWEHSRNGELRQCREHRDILAPGDLLYVPPPRRHKLAVSSGMSNRFQATTPRAPITIVLMNGTDPIANERCVIEGAGPEHIELETDAHGRLSFEVPLLVHEVRLTFHDGRTVYPVLIGHMDPINERSGVRSRLEHLGYFLSNTDDDELDGWDDRWLAHAIRRFQQDHRLDVTGVMDDTTRAALSRIHGS